MYANKKKKANNVSPLLWFVRMRARVSEKVEARQNLSHPLELD